MENKYEMTILENISPEEAAKQMPTFIGNSIDSLKKIQEKIQETKKKAEEAKKQAEKAWLVKIGFWHRTTPALEALQQAGKCQSEAVIGISECQELLFQQQYILAQCSKFLFMLCCANLAAARIAVHEIHEKLKGASEYEISDIAKNELQKTMQQLKQQMDLLERQDKLQDKVEKLNAEMKQKEEEIELQKNRVSGLETQLAQCNFVQQRMEKTIVSDVEKMYSNTKKQMDDFCNEYKKKLDLPEEGDISQKIAKIQRLLIAFIVVLLLLFAVGIFLFMKIIY